MYLGGHVFADLIGVITGKQITTRPYLSRDGTGTGSEFEAVAGTGPSLVCNVSVDITNTLTSWTLVSRAGGAHKFPTFTGQLTSSSGRESKDIHQRMWSDEHVALMDGSPEEDVGRVVTRSVAVIAVNAVSRIGLRS
ncbi:hypothetical protein J6590_014105 [Homalodisca vitripennis]|nr:hypothetical protein J6590_014105 [Homalodisca vitripennis]